MKNQKVIEIIRAGLAWANWTDEQKEAFIIAGEAVKKQIPQRTIEITTVNKLGRCPVCMDVISPFRVKYCSGCGQRLHWD